MSPFDDDIVIHPQKTKRDKNIPSAGVLCVNPGEAKVALDLIIAEGGEKRFLHNSGLVVSRDNSRFIAGPAIGSPAAALVLEKLIVLGAMRIFFLGWCGAIDPDVKIGDIIIPIGTVSGEGTSAYYQTGKVPKPSRTCTERMGGLLESLSLPWRAGKVWSTDAPYRESRKYMESLYRNEQVSCVDMEFSALCNVAAFRNVEFCGVMVVSDELYRKSWRPGFKDSLFKERCSQILDCLLHKEL